MNTTERPFEVRITNVEEVRMGSPYHCCDIELVGFDKLQLPKNSWQDKYAWDEDPRRLLLIKWDFENNNPGFHLYLITIDTGQIKESPRLFGLPNNVSIVGDKIKINKFLYNKEKSKSGDLCCHVDEEFEFIE